MRKILLSIQVCNFSDVFVGTIKVATTENMIMPIMQRLTEAGIITRGYTADYLEPGYANAVCQASWLVAELLTEQTELKDYVKLSPNIDQIVHFLPKSQN